jgi:hypothetical protein
MPGARDGLTVDDLQKLVSVCPDSKTGRIFGRMTARKHVRTAGMVAFMSQPHMHCVLFITPRRLRGMETGHAQLMSPMQAQREFGLGHRSVRRLIEDRVITGFNISRGRRPTWRVDRYELMRYVQSIASPGVTQGRPARRANSDRRDRLMAGVPRFR